MRKLSADAVEKSQKNFDKKIAHIINAKIEAQKLSIKYLSNICGVSESTLRRYLSGESSMPLFVFEQLRIELHLEYYDGLWYPIGNTRTEVLAFIAAAKRLDQFGTILFTRLMKAYQPPEGSTTISKHGIEVLLPRKINYKKLNYDLLYRNYVEDDPYFYQRYEKKEKERAEYLKLYPELLVKRRK